MFILLNLTDGERDIVAELYGKYKNRVYTVAYRILRRREDAEDAVCETFVRIIRDIKYFSGRKCEDVDRLIVKYSRWTAINLYNKRKRHASGIRDITDEEGGFDVSHLPGDDMTPEEAAEKRDLTDAVRRAVDALPEKYRDILVMRYHDEMKISDIATLCGLTESAVNMRIARAKAMIEKRLGEEGYFDE